MDLTTRDVALLSWLGIVAAFVVGRRDTRESSAGVLRALRGKLTVLLVVYAIYLAGIVAVAQRLGAWNPGLLKDTIAWVLVPGFVLLFSSTTKAYEGRRYYVRTVLRVIGLTAIIEVYVNLAAFPLWVELLLLPVLVVVTAMSVVAGMKAENRVVKRFADGIISVVGFLILAGTTAHVVGEWDRLDKPELALTFALPIWLTLFALPFIFLFSLYANYETTFVRIDLSAKDAPARRRAKLALLATYHIHNRELHRFTGEGPRELARAASWAEARQIIAVHRARARLQEAKEEYAAKRLIRYAGVEGTDWEGEPLDRREIAETKEALKLLHTFHTAQHVNGRYRDDIMTIVGGLLSNSFPESEIVMTLGPKRRSWFAWRRTIGGWVLGVGAAGAPPDIWTWEQSEPPDGQPGPGTAWKRRDSDKTDDAD